MLVTVERVSGKLWRLFFFFRSFVVFYFFSTSCWLFLLLLASSTQRSCEIFKFLLLYLIGLLLFANIIFFVERFSSKIWIVWLHGTKSYATTNACFQSLVGYLFLVVCVLYLPFSFEMIESSWDLIVHKTLEVLDVRQYALYRKVFFSAQHEISISKRSNCKLYEIIWLL